MLYVCSFNYNVVAIAAISFAFDCVPFLLFLIERNMAGDPKNKKERERGGG